MLRFSRSNAQPADRKTRIVDSAAAKAWLAAMAQPIGLDHLAEMAEVLRTLGAQGVDDGSANLPPQRKFAIAERIRGVLMHVLNDRGNDGRFAVLPLDDDEARQFWAVVETALALRDAYSWLVSQLSDSPVQAEATLTGATGAGPAAGPDAFVSGIVTLHRALDINAQVMLCIQRARWPVPAKIWERHCVLGQMVRDLDCQDVEVADPLKATSTRTCRAAFVMPILIALADPAARSTAEYEVVRMAAQRWSAKVGFRLERRTDAGSSPLRPVANPGPSLTLGQYVLRFDTQSAIQSIDRRLEALADGKTPQEVGIGSSLRPLVARDLLLMLRQRWGAVSPLDVDSPDRPWRIAPAGVQVMAIVGLPTRQAGRVDGGQPVVRAGQNPYAYQRVRHGGITRPREEIENERIAQLLANAETWTLAAESADAVRCVRRYARPKLGLQRLIGLKLDSGDRASPFLVGWVEALQGTLSDREDPVGQRSTSHTVRVRLAPGLPQILHAAIDDVEVDGAFLLVPGATVGGAPRPAAYTPMLTDAGSTQMITARDTDGWDAVRASPRDYGLLLPHATFRPQRLVKAGRRGVVAMLRLEELMMRGSDFDLVRFTPM